jgi:hypothetical protein
MEKFFTPNEVRKLKKIQNFNVYGHFSTMGKNNTTMLQQFVETNVLFITHGCPN